MLESTCLEHCYGSQIHCEKCDVMDVFGCFERVMVGGYIGGYCLGRGKINFFPIGRVTRKGFIVRLIL